MIKKDMEFDYDVDGDILYCTWKEGKGLFYDAYPKGLYVRIDMETNEPCGFLILSFSDYIEKQHYVEIPGVGFIIPPLVDCFGIYEKMEDMFEFADDIVWDF